MSLQFFLANKPHHRVVQMSAVVVLVGCLLAAPGTVYAQSEEEPVVVRVEEDWQIVLNQPDNNVDSPQFHTVMSPVLGIDGNYAQVVWNYREYPDFAAGGLQLQGWYGEELVRSRTVRTMQLSTTAETISWTQVLEVAEDGLYFEIINGMSETWGAFGKDMRLQQGGSYENLNQYTTDVSVLNSCVTYGTNRVDSLMITQVRKFGADGQLISVDDTPRKVYEYGMLDVTPSDDDGELGDMEDLGGPEE